METGKADRPIINNDDWLDAASEYYIDLMDRYVRDMPLSMVERRIIDGISAKIGRKPETVHHYLDRLRRTGQLTEPRSAQRKTVEQVVAELPPGSRITPSW